MVFKRFSPGQRLLFIFGLTIFVPGLLLAIFGARTLWQERERAALQLQDRLNLASQFAADALDDHLDRLQDSVMSGLPPEAAFQSLPDDDSWTFVERQGKGLRAYPARALPYSLTWTATVWPDPIFAAGRALETRGADSMLIAAEYQQLLGKAGAALVPEINHRIARAWRKAGKLEQAKKLWRQVQDGGGAIGNLPADFVAASEMALLDEGDKARFCANLIAGRWRLEKVRYLYYLSEVCHTVDPRMPLAEVLEAAANSASSLLEGDGGTYLSLRRDDSSAVLVLSPGFLSAHLWPRLSTAIGKEIRVVKVTANGRELFATPDSNADSTLSEMQTLDRPELSWRVHVAPVDTAGLQATMARATNVYLAILAGVVVLLGFGGYFMARTIRRELEVARMKADFVSTVSHEFRSPLTGIRQLGEMLSRGRVTEPEKRQQYYDLIVHESDRLTRLVENVLDFARMENGRKQYSFEVLDTTAWLKAVADDFERDASRTGHRLESRIPENLPAVHGDREALSTALRNLLDNACKYSPQSKTVWLDAEPFNGGVRLQVRDRGVGIPAREQSRIFEKFYRGVELERQVKGAGLGLSLVRHIVASHDGAVSVESRKGEGSTFSIHLTGTA